MHISPPHTHTHSRTPHITRTHHTHHTPHTHTSLPTHSLPFHVFRKARKRAPRARTTIILTRSPASFPSHNHAPRCSHGFLNSQLTLATPPAALHRSWPRLPTRTRWRSSGRTSLASARGSQTQRRRATRGVCRLSLVVLCCTDLVFLNLKRPNHGMHWLVFC